MNRQQARRLITRVIQDLHDAEQAVLELWDGQAWLVLDYPDWAAMCAAEFGALRELNGTGRKALVAGMTQRKMSTRAQAAVVGVTRQTVMNDQDQVVTDLPPDATVIGLDGKTYTRPPPKPPAPSAPKPSLEQMAQAWADRHIDASLADAYLAGWNHRT